MAALLLFLEAARQEVATRELVQDLASYLKRARGNPEMRFGGRSKAVKIGERVWPPLTGFCVSDHEASHVGMDLLG